MAAALAAASLTLMARPAAAYVRYLSESGCPYAWHTRRLSLVGFPKGMPDLDLTQITQAITAAAGEWDQTNPDLTTCTDLNIGVTMMSLTVATPNAKFDYQNKVIFRSDTWCPDPTTGCHDPSALAITSVFARTWGEIVDADIEVNAFDFHWGDLVSMPAGGGKQDLQNALTHEVGHFIGLDHTCYDGNPAHNRPVDQNGNPIPDCTALDVPAAVRATTMFASADPGDTSKRTLEPDDRQAACDAYPRGKADPLQCAAPPSSGGCSVAPPIGSQCATAVTGGCTVGHGQATGDLVGSSLADSWSLWAQAGAAALGLLLAARARRVAPAAKRSAERRS